MPPIVVERGLIEKLQPFICGEGVYISKASYCQPSPAPIDLDRYLTWNKYAGLIPFYTPDEVQFCKSYTAFYLASNQLCAEIPEERQRQLRSIINGTNRGAAPEEEARASYSSIYALLADGVPPEQMRRLDKQFAAQAKRVSEGIRKLRGLEVGSPQAEEQKVSLYKELRQVCVVDSPDSLKALAAECNAVAAEHDKVKGWLVKAGAAVAALIGVTWQFVRSGRASRSVEGARRAWADSSRRGDGLTLKVLKVVDAFVRAKAGEGAEQFHPSGPLFMPPVDETGPSAPAAGGALPVAGQQMEFATRVALAKDAIERMAEAFSPPMERQSGVALSPNVSYALRTIGNTTVTERTKEAVVTALLHSDQMLEAYGAVVRSFHDDVARRWISGSAQLLEGLSSKTWYNAEAAITEEERRASEEMARYREVAFLSSTLKAAVGVFPERRSEEWKAALEKGAARFHKAHEVFSSLSNELLAAFASGDKGMWRRFVEEGRGLGLSDVASVARLAAAIHEEAASRDGVRIEVRDLSRSTAPISVDRGLDLLLVLHEGMENSLEHGFPEGFSGREKVVRVEVASDGQGVAVSDNGSGYLVGEEGQKAGGLGVVRELARENGWGIRSSSTLGGGTRVELAFGDRPGQAEAGAGPSGGLACGPMDSERVQGMIREGLEGSNHPAIVQLKGMVAPVLWDAIIKQLAGGLSAGELARITAPGGEGLGKWVEQRVLAIPQRPSIDASPARAEGRRERKEEKREGEGREGEKGEERSPVRPETHGKVK